MRNLWRKSNNSTNNSSPSSSPHSNSSQRKDITSLFSSRKSTDNSNLNQQQQPKLTRLRKLRHLSDVEVKNQGRSASSASTPVSRSPSNLEATTEASTPVRSVSTPVPLPRPGTSPSSSKTGFRLPSPTDRGQGVGYSDLDLSWSSDQGANMSTYRRDTTSPEHVAAPSGKSMFSYYRMVLHDPNSIESENFRLHIPAKSAPASGFSSPVVSPRRRSDVEFIPSKEFMTGYSMQTSPEKFSPGHYTNSRSPIRSRNLSAPQSPHHNGHATLHPLPLPPGAAPKIEPSHWQKQNLIGSGSFGNVYKAMNLQTGATCAMKEVNIIHDDPRSAECLKQLEQEIKVLSQLEHPNIVKYIGSEMTEDRLLIYLEYVFPGAINKYVRDHCGAMTESVVRNFTRHILNGLAYLHGSKNIHRDIKGANLLVDVDGVVKLADFGTAKHLDEVRGVSSMKGTPYWMAPEVIQSTMNKGTGYDYAVDIWSLGCTIIEMFTGKHPWSGFNGAQAMFKVLNKDPEIPDSLSSEGKEFLRLCFQRNPAERPPASELLKHAFIRNTHYHNKHGSLQAFAGIRNTENAYTPRDHSKPKSEYHMKGKQIRSGETSPETSASAEARQHTHSMPEGIRTKFVNTNRSNHLSISPTGFSTSSTTTSTANLTIQNNQPYALPKPHEKEVLNFF